mmetsp:Transcript_165746/g.402809  ORF Transcript_165746/g.402809 Transcript_165746/m.402809 type:complete len:320 (+) Transcript_165746:202-1161(+)
MADAGVQYARAPRAPVHVDRGGEHRRDDGHALQGRDAPSSGASPGRARDQPAENEDRAKHHLPRRRSDKRERPDPRGRAQSRGDSRDDDGAGPERGGRVRGEHPERRDVAGGPRAEARVLHEPVGSHAGGEPGFESRATDVQQERIRRRRDVSAQQREPGDHPDGLDAVHELAHVQVRGAARSEQHLAEHHRLRGHRDSTTQGEKLAQRTEQQIRRLHRENVRRDAQAVHARGVHRNHQARDARGRDRVLRVRPVPGPVHGDRSRGPPDFHRTEVEPDTRLQDDGHVRRVPENRQGARGREPVDRVEPQEASDGLENAL